VLVKSAVRQATELLPQALHKISEGIALVELLHELGEILHGGLALRYCKQKQSSGSRSCSEGALKHVLMPTNLK